MSIKINPKPIYQGIALVYVFTLGIVILVFGFADFSVADGVANPAQGSVIGCAIALILAGGFRLWYDAITVEKEVWSGHNAQNNSNRRPVGLHRNQQPPRNVTNNQPETIDLSPTPREDENYPTHWQLQAEDIEELDAIERQIWQPDPIPPDSPPSFDEEEEDWHLETEMLLNVPTTSDQPREHPSLENQTTTGNNDRDPFGCAGITSVFGKVVGTLILVLWLPFLFTQVGEWLYHLSWWIFKAITGWWSPLRFLIAIAWGLSYFVGNSFVNCGWLLSRVLFFGFLFPNQLLFQYTVIPAVVGLWGRNGYQWFYLSQSGSER